jgi:hypothetical protein
VGIRRGMAKWLKGIERQEPHNGAIDERLRAQGSGLRAQGVRKTRHIRQVR